MIFYHGTSEEKWKGIQEEGILFGRHGWEGHECNYRYTYMSPDRAVAEAYGDVLLEVEYEPVGVGVKVEGKAIDNYGFDPPPGQTCWQFSVFIPIDLSRVKRIDKIDRE